jgi:Outer membrane protein beta-barrel domain
MRFFFILVCSFISVTTVLAQKEKGQFTVSVLAGTNGYQTQLANPSIGIDIVRGDQTSWSYMLAEFTASPTLGLGVDYGINRNFSLGLALGYNTLSVQESNIRVHYLGTSSDMFTDYGHIDYKATRYTFSLRPLFHYGKNPKFDMYSGLRINASIFSQNLDTSIDGLTADRIFPDFDKVGYFPAIIPFGIRYYFTESIAFGLETHLGPPSWGNLMFAARF